ncbi:MAG TPA: hypothetical protein VEL07_12225 [Planctomycetota bacterium]|nr:hypothetical protein [Planctomycetota bacterium]
MRSFRRTGGLLQAGMGWWQERGGTVMMVGGLWLMLSDPIDRWLPVPTPVLVPGPTTTWLPGGALPDAAAIDAGRPVAAGDEALARLLSILGSERDGQTLSAFLAGIDNDALSEALTAGDRRRWLMLSGDIGWSPRDAGKAAAWSDRCAEALVALGPVSTLPLRVPTASSPATAEVDGVLRAPEIHLALVHLATATRLASEQAIAADDAAAALAHAASLMRLAVWCAGIGDVAALATAHASRAAAESIAMRLLASRPGDEPRRAAILALRRPPPSSDVRRAVVDLRLLVLRWVIAVDRSRRDGKADPGAPADVNVALAAINGWCDRLATVASRPETWFAMSSIAIDALPRPVEVPDIDLPLANIMVFGVSESERAAYGAQSQARTVTGWMWTMMARLIEATRDEAATALVLDAMLAVDPRIAEPAAYAQALERHIGAGSWIAVEHEGESVRVLRLGEAGDASEMVRISFGKPIP